MVIPKIEELTNEVVQESSAEFKQIIRDSVKKGIEAVLANSYSGPVYQSLSPIIEDWVAKEFRPEVERMFNEKKPELLAEVEKGMRAHILVFHEALLRVVVENMQEDWKRRTFFEKLFKGEEY